MIFDMLMLGCLTTLLVNATPIMLLRDKLGLLEMNEDYSSFRNRFIELLSCAMCLGFWVGFVFFVQNEDLIRSVLLGSGVSILSEYINKKMRI